MQILRSGSHYMENLEQTAFAFRGYNVRNLGRSRELLRHSLYGDIVREHLEEASGICSRARNRRVDLVDRVERGEESSLEAYDESVSLIVAMEVAEIRLLEKFYDVDLSQAALVYGYSLGEIASLVCGGVFELDAALGVLLSLVDDCVALSENVVTGVLMSHHDTLPMEEVRRACVAINQQGQGVMGLAAYLMPNSVLLMGQDDTLDRFLPYLQDRLNTRLHLWKDFGRWPPVHTMILWERQVPNRYAQLMHTMEGGFTSPRIPLMSMVTGQHSYTDYNAREMIHRWIDHPQRLWDAIRRTLELDVQRVVHVGPQPSLISQTFRRYTNAVKSHVRGNGSGVFRSHGNGNGNGKVHAGSNGKVHAGSNGKVRAGGNGHALDIDDIYYRTQQIEHIALEDFLLEEASVVAASANGNGRAGRHLI